MSQTPPRHPQTLFSLIPKSPKAKNVTAHMQNRHLARMQTGENEGVYALDIGFHIQSKARYVLATIGRSPVADIYVETLDSARIQCTFEIVPSTGHILVYDRSTQETTQFFGPTARSYQPGRKHRCVLIRSSVNEQIGFGGADHNIYLFDILWHKHKININKETELRYDDIRYAVSADITKTAAPSRVTTRIHTPGNKELKVRYHLGSLLGEGSFGRVFRVIDIDNGADMACKIIALPQPHEVGAQAANKRVKKEVDALKRLSHPCIVEFITAQSSEDDRHFEIFTAAKTGDIRQLIWDEAFKNHDNACSLLRQMLRAVDCLHAHELIHRDIKPANILYSPCESGFRFQIADFGFSTLVSPMAISIVGTPMFMAPEMFAFTNTPQSTKIDVWGLMVTFMYAVDEPLGFRARLENIVDSNLLIPSALHRRLQEVIQESVLDNYYHQMHPMTESDPAKRPSAGDMLDILFGGVDRITMRLSNSLSLIDVNKPLIPSTSSKVSKMKNTELKRKLSAMKSSIPSQARAALPGKKRRERRIRQAPIRSQGN